MICEETMTPKINAHINMPVLPLACFIMQCIFETL